MSRQIAPTLLAVSLTLALSACGPSQEEQQQAQAQQAAQAAQAQAAEQYALYEEARLAGNYEFAASHGELIMTQYPDSDAARQLQASFEEVRAQAEASRERRRLEGLWVYHEVDEEGAMTRTAYIYSEAPARAVPPVRLVLRQHPEWGESIYLLPDGEQPRFACANPCEINIRFDDGEAAEFEATVSEPTENHAMFIGDAEAFIAGLSAAQRVHVQAESEGGEPIELRYDVGGFDASRYAGAGDTPEGAQTRN